MSLSDWLFGEKVKRIPVYVHASIDDIYDPPKFCIYCGTKLEKTGEILKVYDVETGKLVHVPSLHCPTGTYGSSAHWFKTEEEPWPIKQN